MLHTNFTNKSGNLIVSEIRSIQKDIKKLQSLDSKAIRFPKKPCPKIYEYQTNVTRLLENVLQHTQDLIKHNKNNL